MPADMTRISAYEGGTVASLGPFSVALAIASLIHLIVILAVSFAYPRSSPTTHAKRPLEVIVLRRAAPSDKKPEIADAFAQVDREGGGAGRPREAEIEPAVEPESEIPEPEQDLAQVISLPPPPLIQQQPAPEQPPVAEEVLAQPEPLAEPPPESAPPQVTAAQILASRNLEIAALTSRIRRGSRAYANRPRRKAISASTREYKYASYLESWRRKVERVGNLNYPEEAKRHKMYGSLILHVAVRSDGSVEGIRVLRSSGFDLLDEAAVRIVQLSAPFSPFPPDIKAETDVLDITRTWKFLSSNRLGWEN
jgi:protein TonB